MDPTLYTKLLRSNSRKKMLISLNIQEGSELFTCRTNVSLDASLNKQLGTYTFVDDVNWVCFVPFQVFTAVLVKNKVMDITFLLSVINYLTVGRVSYQKILI
jgi:hypothetical protein